MDKNNFAPRPASRGRSTERRARSCARRPASCTSRRCSTSTRTRSSATAIRELHRHRERPPPPARRPSRAPSRRPRFALPTQSIVAIDDDFSTQYAILTNVQLERALSSNLSVSIGYVNSIGRNMPVLVDSNLVPTGAALADGRPIYSTAVNAATRVNPAFNHIDVFQSIGIRQLQRAHRAGEQADEPRLPDAGQLHPGQGRRQRAPHQHVHRGQLRRPSLRSFERRPRRGPDALQPDPHLHLQRRHPAADRGRRRGRRSATTTSSASSSRPTAACPSTSARTWT